MESGLVGLRAELHKKRVEASKYGVGQKGLPRRDIEKQIKKSTSFHTSNAGVSARADKDKEQLEEETVTEENARSILEKKAAMYEKLHGGVEALEDDELNQKYLIDFQKKIVDQVLERKKLRTKEENSSKNQSKQEKSNPDDYKALIDEEEWVEYIDAFGRTRECMKKDLPAMLEQDQELARDINQVSYMDNTPTNVDLLSEDMRREIQRQKWEREEELNALKKDLHYQDVLYNEARAHGAGYMKFSRDEKKRKEQIDLLKELRAESQRAEVAKATATSKKEKLLKARLEKVRQRKRLKMGLPMLENDKLKTPPASDDEDGNNDVNGSPAPPASLEDKSIGSGLKEMKPKINKPHVREWDLGKEGVTSILSQEEWVDRQRKQRNNEFAPPSIYDSHKKCKYSQNEPDGGSSSSNIPQEYFSKSSYDLQSERKFSQACASQGSSQLKNSTHDSSRDCLGEGRNPKFAPPSTFEYYGPSALKGRNHHSKIHYKTMEETIDKGLAHFRKMSDK